MSMVMVKCPQTGRAIPTGIKSDRESFRRSPVFFGRMLAAGLVSTSRGCPLERTLDVN